MILFSHIFAPVKNINLFSDVFQKLFSKAWMKYVSQIHTYNVTQKRALRIDHLIVRVVTFDEAVNLFKIIKLTTDF